MRSDSLNGTAATLPADGPTDDVVDRVPAIAGEHADALARIARLAARSAAAPSAFVSIGAPGEQRIVATHGLPTDLSETPLASLIAVADDVVVVTDASRDDRLTEPDLTVADLSIGAGAGVAVRDGSGEIVGIVGILWSKPHHPSEQALDSLRDAAALAAPVAIASQGETADRDRRLRSLELMLAHTNDVVIVVDTAGRITAASPSIETVLGFPADLDLPDGAIGLVHPEDRTLARRGLAAALADGDDVFHVRVLTSTGSFRNMDCTVVDHFDKPEIRGAVVTMRDVSERHMLNQMLTFQRTHDRLTELPNLTQFQEHLRPALSRATRLRSSVSVCVLDLDGFADLNRELGHDAGDELLVEVAKRIRSTVRTGDTVSRISGDEFAVLLDPVVDLEEATAVAQRILDAIAGPHSLRAGVSNCTARCGIAVSTDEDDVSTIITRAVDARRGIDRGSIGGGWTPPPAPAVEPLPPHAAASPVFTNDAFTNDGLTSDAFTNDAFTNDAFSSEGAFVPFGDAGTDVRDEPADVSTTWGRRATDLFPPDEELDAESDGIDADEPEAPVGFLSFGDEPFGCVDEDAWGGFDGEPSAHALDTTSDVGTSGSLDDEERSGESVDVAATSWFDEDDAADGEPGAFGIVFDERF